MRRSKLIPGCLFETVKAVGTLCLLGGIPGVLALAAAGAGLFMSGGGGGGMGS